MMEQIILETISKQMKDKQVIRDSQHRFMKWQSCLINLITFCDELMGLVEEGRAVDVVYLNCIKAFSAVSNNIFIGKLMKYRRHI